jgi:ABC-type transport system substrate-binding protein
MNQEGEISPQLATGYVDDPAAKTITITLRKGVKFHDGTDFNAAICKWNLDQYRSGTKPELKAVSSVDVIDDYTIRLNLSVYQNTLLNRLAFAPGQMISKATYDANGKDWCEKNPVGAGAFKFVSWEKSVIIKFTRNDQYWGGKPYLDGVNVVFCADATGALMDMKAGNLDMGSSDARSVNDLVASGKFYVINRLTGQTPALTTDATTDGSPFKDVQVRRALSYALDTKTMADSFGYGFFTVTNQWAIPGTTFYNPNVVGYPYNPQKAKELLTAAGYPNGLKTTFHYNAYRPTNTDWAAAIQSYLKAVGIELTLDPMQSGAYNDLAALGKGFTGILHVMGSPQVDPLLTYANVATSVEFNGMLKPQEFKDTYNKAVAVADQKTKKQLVWDLLAMATDKYCMQNFFWVETTQLSTNINLKDVSVLAYNRIDPSKAWFIK